MRVLVTGMIAGMDDKKFLKDVLNLAKKDKMKLEYFHLIEEMEKSGKKTLAKMLGTTNYLFEVLREREYAKIGFELQKRKAKNAIIRVPATIEWNHINYKMKDHKEIASFIAPDVVVTLIDAEWEIRKNLRKKHDDSFLEALRHQDFTFYEILSWMNEEVSLAEDWAKFCGVPHYVIPIGQSPHSVYKLIKYRDVPSYYVSYSMTHCDADIRKEINTTIKKLSDYGLIIDPQAIELGDYNESERDKKISYAYTVHRDLHWFVGKVDGIIAIHPYAKRPPLSTGMMDELGHARDYLKKRYMIFPPEVQSPFTTDSYIDKGKIFSTPEELFLCLEAEGIKPLKNRNKTLKSF